ncbi:MAG: hypothetical protein BWY99_01410 [Synergistetes bacterium ADurb.BinA166]|nr:MAG: hypothetical protein BWY99_01410 [Synergistetes bacterium ADurb.BinA166]
MVIRGPDITAGSTFIFFAAKGRNAPTRLPIITTPTTEIATVSATPGPVPMVQARSEASRASTVPSSRPERLSFSSTCPRSASSISPTVRPRITRVEA